MIPFNKIHVTGKEIFYMVHAMADGKISGAGQFSKKCANMLNNLYGYEHTLLTTSCSDALEMCAMLIDIGPGDEIIMPSYTFVSTANAFIRQGAKVIFADSTPQHPNIDPDSIANAITAKTKAVVVIHYGGIEPNMDKIIKLCKQHNIVLIEDAAQSIHSQKKNQWLGKKSDLAVMSFHDSKNITCGEGGLLIINNQVYKEKAEILWEKGTNRYNFTLGKVHKYEWLDIGSSFLMADLNAAYLYAQLENADTITANRKKLWHNYAQQIQSNEFMTSCHDTITRENDHNAHIFYLDIHSALFKEKLLQVFKKENIYALSHYLALHNSPYYLSKNDKMSLPNAERFEHSILRLPLYMDLTISDQERVINCVNNCIRTMH